MGRRFARVLVSLVALVSCLMEEQVLSIGAPSKSVSSTRQFTIYCDDAGVRSAVVGFAEEVKSELLGLLGTADQWKFPVVVYLSKERSTSPGKPTSSVKLYETEVGFKIQLDVVIGEDPASAKFREQLCRAIFLEIAYRDKPSLVKEGMLVEPPEWLIYGSLAWVDARNSGVDPEVFKALLNAPRPPSLVEFLAQQTAGSDSASEEFYRACSLALVKLMVEMPDGRSRLLDYLRNLPEQHEDATKSLGKHFPEMAGSEKKLEKWWTLSLARLSGANRYLGLSVEETSQKLDGLLIVKVPGKKEAFELDDFKDYLKLEQSRPVLMALGAELLALAANASPLLRPIVAEYHEIVILLGQGKTAGISRRLSQVAKDRELVGQRLLQVSDYMNWFEATQMPAMSGAFKNYLESARRTEPLQQRRKDAISVYLDTVEAEFE